MNITQKLVSDTHDMLACLKSGTITLAEETLSLPSSIYTDTALFQQEKERIFRRLPLMLAASCELPGKGDYKAMDVAGVPVLIIRGKDGVVRTFLNSCTHRGAKLATGCGHAQRLTCPYHAWTFDTDGTLRAIASRGEFGEVDISTLGLIQLPATERSGLIWASLTPDAAFDFDTFLSSIDGLLTGFDFGSWTHFRTQEMKGANWKLAFDAHLEFYHLPVLHKNTFGSQTSNQAQYYYYGPHQRLGHISKKDHVLEMDDVAGLAHLPPEEWPINSMLFGEWILFPNVSINCFYKGGRGVIISQVFPGASVEESTTVQIFLHERAPQGELVKEAEQMADFLGHVVGQEDLPLSQAQQAVMNSGLLPMVQFGKNEGGLQHFHRWAQHFTSANTKDDLARIMAEGPYQKR